MPDEIINLHFILTEFIIIDVNTGDVICDADIIITKQILVQIQFKYITERNKNNAVIKTDALKTEYLLNILINFGANKVEGIAKIDDTANINAIVSDSTEKISSK